MRLTRLSWQTISWEMSLAYHLSALCAEVHKMLRRLILPGQLLMVASVVAASHGYVTHIAPTPAVPGAGQSFVITLSGTSGDSDRPFNPQVTVTGNTVEIHVEEYGGGAAFPIVWTLNVPMSGLPQGTYDVVVI